MRKRLFVETAQMLACAPLVVEVIESIRPLGAARQSVSSFLVSTVAASTSTSAISASAARPTGARISPFHRSRFVNG